MPFWFSPEYDASEEAADPFVLVGLHYNTDMKQLIISLGCDCKPSFPCIRLRIYYSHKQALLQNRFTHLHLVVGSAVWPGRAGKGVDRQPPDSRPIQSFVAGGVGLRKKPSYCTTYDVLCKYLETQVPWQEKEKKGHKWKKEEDEKQR